MRSYILIGSTTARNAYLEEYITTHHVKSYDVLRFDDKVGIGDVRTIQKMLSFMPEKGQIRCITLSSTITTEAQNALLKTLEEIPSYAHIFIHSTSQESLLPTVISRCQIVTLSEAKQQLKEDGEYEKILNALLFSDNDMSDISIPFIFEQRLQEGTRDPFTIEACILVIRSIIKKRILSAKTSDDLYLRTTLLPLLKKLSDAYPLATNNNVNQRFSLEAIFLSVVTAWETS